MMAEPDWTEDSVRGNGLDLHYHRTGSRAGQSGLPILILLHGFTDNGLCFSRLARVLESRFDVVMPDARNHGQSGRGPATLHDLAADVAALIVALELAPAAVLGHSVGATTAAALAGQFPDLVERMVLEDPPWSAKPPRPTSQKQLDAFQAHIESMVELSDAQITEQGQTQHPSWPLDEFPAWVTAKRQVASDALAQLELGDWQTLVTPIQCPTLLLYADSQADGIVSHKTANDVARRNSHFQVQAIAGAGHNIRREQFEVTAAAVSAFL